MKQDGFWMLSTEERAPVLKQDLQQNVCVQFPASLIETRLCKGAAPLSSYVKHLLHLDVGHLWSG